MLVFYFLVIGILISWITRRIGSVILKDSAVIRHIKLMLSKILLGKQD
jgi:hypothetical protein